MRTTRLKWTLGIALAAVVIAIMVLSLRTGPTPEHDDLGADVSTGATARPGLAARPDPTRTQEPGGRTPIPEVPAAHSSNGTRWRLRLGAFASSNSSRALQPLPGATARVVLARGDETSVLGTYKAGADGRIDVALAAIDRLSPAARATCYLYCDRARAPGHWLQTQTQLASDELRGPPQTIEATVTLAPGPLASGRIIDEGGKPVADAQVALYEEGEDFPTGGRTDEEGHYFVGVPGTGKGWLYASADGVGTGVLRAARWSDADVELPDIVLVGRGSIAGVVVTADGTPAPDVPVAFASTAIAKDARESLAAPPGIDYGRVRTDRRGRFLASGLRDGRFRLRVGAAPTSASPGVEAVAGTDDVRIVLDGHLLVVRALDESGTEILGAAVSVSDSKKPAAGREAAGIDPLDSHSFLVRPSSQLLVRAQVPGFAVAEQDVAIGPGSGPTIATLTIKPAGPVGHLRLSLAGDASAVTQVRLRIHGVSANTPSGWKAGDAPIDLLPGSYRVYALPLDAASGGNHLLTPYVDQDFHLEVHAGEAANLAIPIMLGGRVRVDVEIPDSIDKPALEGAEMRLVDGGEPLATEWAQDYADGSTSYGPSLWTLRRDAPFRSGNALPVGRYRIVFSISGCKPVEAIVQIEPRKMSAVRIRPEPK